MRRARPAAILALLLSLVAALLPAAAPGFPLPAAFAPATTLAAADGIDISTSTRYTVQPAAQRVHVTVAISAVNRKSNAVTPGGVTRYFYDGVNLGVQPEARRFRAAQGGSPVRVRAADRQGYRLVTVRFRANIYLGERADLTLSFDLPAGRPRSDSDVRVGSAFATFTAWAFGDDGRVRVEVPSDFRVDIAGGAMEPEPGQDGLQAWSARTTDPPGWYAWVNATNDAALTHQRLTLDDGEEVVIRAWPEDRRWRSRVRELLGAGLPQLVDRIGLPWPVEGALLVTEVHTPLLEGYAGFYDPEADAITISEDLDDLTMIHEASHAWFNASLFSARWITEGLADEYAARVLRAEDRGYPGPDRVTRRAEAAFPLDDWPPPAAIRDEASRAREAYGYDAAWSLMRRIVTRVGEPGMREVFVAAAGKTIAYPGEGDPERTRRPNDWRRFLDLAENAARPGPAGDDAPTIAELVRTWALTDVEAAELPARTGARAAYATLAATGGTWAPPEVVRVAMDEWDFADAGAAVRASTGVLETRDAIAALAATEGLAPATKLEGRYQEAGSQAELNVVAEEASQSLAALRSIAAAGDAAAAPRDWLTEWGLDGTDPVAGVAAAGSAWEAGDVDAARVTAEGVVATVAAAPEAGRTKAIVAAAAIVAGVVLLLILLLVILERRRGGRVGRVQGSGASSGGASPAGAASPVAGPSAAWPGAGASASPATPDGGDARDAADSATDPPGPPLPPPPPSR